MIKPKLALIPSGYSEGKLYSVLPSNGDGDFTFSRGSNATRVNKDGLIETVDEDLPRLDYSDSSCPSLLLEPQRTNLVTYSEDFTEWTLSNSGNGQTPILTSNYATNLGLNASRIIFNRASASATNISSIRGNDYTQSTNTFSIYIKSNTSNVSIDFRLGSSIVPYEITTQWKRIEFSGSDFYRSYFGLLGSSSDLYADLSIVAAQAEEGSYATSYIPTNGATATRYADECNSAGTSDTFNDSEGVLMAEISSLSELDVTPRYIQVSDGTTTANGIQLRYYTTTNLFQALYYTNSAYQAVLSYTLPNSSQNNKIAFKYKKNDFALWVNGVEVGTDTSGLVGATLSELKFDYNNLSNFYGNTKQLQYFQTALTDIELEELTSWESFILMANGQNYTIK